MLDELGREFVEGRERSPDVGRKAGSGADQCRVKPATIEMGVYDGPAAFGKG